MPYTASAELMAHVSVCCEVCGNPYTYARKLRGTGMHYFSGAAASAGARKNLAEQVSKIESGNYGPAADHKPCPQCGYVQSWMVDAVRRRRGWRWALGIAVLTYFVAIMLGASLSSSRPGSAMSDALMTVALIAPFLVFFMARTVIMKRYQPNKGRATPPQPNAPRVSF